MSTLISSFYDPLRHVLGDRDASIQKYSDGSLLAGIQTVVSMGMLPDFSLSATRTSITPTIDDPNDYALLILHTALSFISSDADRWSFRTRAISKSSGGQNNFIWYLQTKISELENGELFDSWQNLSACAHGYNINILNTTVGSSSETTDTSYTLPAATEDSLGGVAIDNVSPTTDPIVPTLDTNGRLWVNAFYVFNPSTGKYRLYQVAADGSMQMSNIEYDKPS